jgi:hypothetical protein
LSTAIFNVTTGKEAFDKDEEEEDDEDNRVEEPEDEAPGKGVSCTVCRQWGMGEVFVSLYAPECRHCVNPFINAACLPPLLPLPPVLLPSIASKTTKVAMPQRMNFCFFGVRALCVQAPWTPRR